MFKLFTFCLDSCIVNKGRSLCMIWAPGSIWKVLQLVWAVFEKFGAGSVSWGGLTAPQPVRCSVGGLTTWCRRSNCPGHSEQNFALCCILMLHSCIGSRGVCFGSGGSLHMCRGSFLCCLSFGLVVCALCLSMVLFRMCRAVALA
jgi:hypothetical protein